MKFSTVVLAFIASVSAIQMESDSESPSPSGPNAESSATSLNMVAATKDMKHMIGTHFLLHAKQDIDSLLEDAKNSEHDANTDKIEEIKAEISELKGHIDILNAAHEEHAESGPAASTLVQEADSDSGSDDEGEDQEWL